MGRIFKGFNRILEDTTKGNREVKGNYEGWALFHGCLCCLLLLFAGVYWGDVVFLKIEDF